MTRVQHEVVALVWFTSKYYTAALAMSCWVKGKGKTLLLNKQKLLEPLTPESDAKHFPRSVVF